MFLISVALSARSPLCRDALVECGEDELCRGEDELGCGEAIPPDSLSKSGSLFTCEGEHDERGGETGGLAGPPQPKGLEGLAPSNRPPPTPNGREAARLENGDVAAELLMGGGWGEYGE